MRRIILLLVGVALLAVAAFLTITQPRPRSTEGLAALTPDVVNGETVFWASGCASCHAAPGAKDEARLVLAGGEQFQTAFGTFVAPNISTDPVQGIGGWTVAQFAIAIQDGISPEGEHYFPAMPYAAYGKMTPQDVVDLKSYMDGLPADATPSQPHQVAFPFNIRRSLGGWKFLFASTDWVLAGDQSAEVTRGRYIVEAMAHCGECHTPRNVLGGLKTAQWMAGAPLPDGKGRTPNVTPGKLTWSDNDIFAYLTTGFTPEFDAVGGSMAHVVDNMAKLPEGDVRDVVAYLKALPAIP